MKYLYLVGLFIVVVGCGGHQSLTKQDTGSLVLSIQWPSSSRVIPIATDHIRIRATYQGRLLTEQSVNRPSGSSQSSVVLNNMPETVRVSAGAYDVSSNLLASGVKEIEIPMGSTTSDTITLSDVSANLRMEELKVTDFRQAAGEAITTAGVQYGSEGSLYVARAVRLSGGSWFVKRRQSIFHGFDLDFEFSVNNAGGYYNGGDGFAIVLQGVDPSATGMQGSGIGYEGITHSLAVEFDMYRNATGYSTPYLADPNNSHVAIMSNGTLANNADHNNNQTNIVATVSPALLTASSHRKARIRYQNSRLEVYVDNMNTPLCSMNSVSLVNLLGLSDTSLYVGVTGATADAWADIRIHSLAFSSH